MPVSTVVHLPGAGAITALAPLRLSGACQCEQTHRCQNDRQNTYDFHRYYLDLFAGHYSTNHVAFPLSRRKAFPYSRPWFAMFIAPAKSIALVLAAYFLMNPAAPGETQPRSISTSRQFIVYGADIPLRGAVCDLAERTKLNLLHLLEIRDDWKTPLVVNLESPQANFPDASLRRLEVSQLGFGLKLQLNLLLGPDLQGREVERELLRAILIEMIYRDRGNIAPGTAYVTPPDWFLDGVLALQSDEDRDANAQLLEGFVAAERVASLDDVVRQDRAKLDSSSRQLYAAYSQALLQLLLDAPDGHQKLVHFLHDLPGAPADPVANLIVHFPETLGRSPDKWWSLSVSKLAASRRYEILSAAETASTLDHLLHFPISGPDGKTEHYSLGDYRHFLKLPAAPAVLQQVSRQLLLLGSRAHPSYHAIVQEDYALAQLLARRKTRGVAERLDRVASYRQLIERQTREIDDYLNWYEATQLKTMSGTFTRLLRDDERGSERPRRRDPISVYLDSIEMEMQ
jgi:hypothetical protein